MASDLLFYLSHGITSYCEMKLISVFLLFLKWQTERCHSGLNPLASMGYYARLFTLGYHLQS